MENKGLVEAGLSRRVGERFPVVASMVTASWLSDWQRMEGSGVLTDISSGGFAARMHAAPVNGRLLHARLLLNLPVGGTGQEIEAEARVCRRVHPDDAADPDADWIVHFAFESLHPVDEKRMAQVLGSLRTGQH